MVPPPCFNSFEILISQNVRILVFIEFLNDMAITAIIGGIHLANADTEILEYTIAKICTINKHETPYLYLNHCSGENAMVAFRQAFKEKMRSCLAGTVLMFT